jgi:lipoprotein-anchoring transpeptidase ErfK/SrfK
MASPPLPARLRQAAADRRLAVAAAAVLVGIGMLTAWILPATASQIAVPTVASVLSTTPPPTNADASTGTPAKPRPASRTHKARNVPERPRDPRHHGRRIVYDKALMTVWLMNAQDEVVARFPVVGRFDRPVKGTYRIFSKSPKAYNPNSKVTFNHMARFTYGPDTRSAIGFHAIPRYYDGTPMHSTTQLGLAIARGGCVRLSEKAAAQVYDFLRVGTLVVVLPSP